MERRPWAVFVGAAFGVTLAVGHVVGGVSGLMHGYERVSTIWFGKEAKGEHSSFSKPDGPLRSHARVLAHELRSEFSRARDKLEQTGIGDFSRVEEALASLRKIDEQIGHVWYFEGEMKRLKNATLFTQKGCLKTLPNGQTQIADVYQQDFYRYLEIASSLPERETGGDTGSEVCYQRANGYCIQRTAWIHHLLANDFYQIAIAANDDPGRAAALDAARKHAKEAHRYRTPEGIEGFVQCIGTLVLEHEIAGQLAATGQRN